MMMVNGVGAYAGAIVSGKVVDMFTVDGVKDWQSIWLIFASYTVVLAIIFQFTFRYDHGLKKPQKKRWYKPVITETCKLKCPVFGAFFYYPVVAIMLIIGLTYFNTVSVIG